MASRTTETLTFENARAAQGLYINDVANLAKLESSFDVKITSRDGWIKIEGSKKESVKLVCDMFAQLNKAQQSGTPIRRHEFDFALKSIMVPQGVALADLQSYKLQFSPKKPPVAPKTIAQRDYLEAIRQKDLVFGIGPAGTGKTYLAVAMAVAALKSEKVSRIVLTRPAVEAGEALGFLPGDLKDKISPYLRPLYDALYTMLDSDEIARHMERNVIELAPLAYMRGRTLSDSFVILDEAQNTTTEQMFMFLTRLGAGSKCVVTGDPTQVDLPHNRKSGLLEAIHALGETEGLQFCRFDESDVVRHELVQRIIRAYRAHRGERMTSMML